MKSRACRFNTYLLAVASLVLAGCESMETKQAARKSVPTRKAEAALLRVHLEANTNLPDRTFLVPVYREHTLLVSVDREPVLHEGHILQATLVDLAQGHAIKIQYDKQGTQLLDNISASFRGRRIAIVSQFGELRWLAAPVLSQRIADGQLMFLPDASREEADRIVRGLNNLVREINKTR